jgi:[acyl-carrier-protein] S-malonyltransferase
MQSAADGMRAVLAALRSAIRPCRWSQTSRRSRDESAGALPEELAVQITSPVLWLDSMGTMQAAGVHEFVEFGPGRVLTGLVRRIDRGAWPRNIGTAEEAQA